MFNFSSIRRSATLFGCPRNVLVALICLLSATILPANAATILVDSLTADIDGMDPACGIREALDSVRVGANNWGCSNSSPNPYGTEDRIVFAEGLDDAINTLEELVVDGVDVHIDASNLSERLALSGNGEHRIFSVRDSTLALTGLDLVGGKSDFNGGAMDINSNSRVTLTRCALYDNQARLGGAIYIRSNAELNIVDSNFSFNKATDPALGGETEGGAIAISGINTHVFISGSIFRRNSADLVDLAGSARGGAIYIVGAESSLEIVRSQFIENSSERFGGAIYVNNDTNVEIRQSFLGENRAFNDNPGVDSFGGAIHVTRGAEVTLLNTTVSENSAQVGAGISLATSPNPATPARLVLNHVTLHKNFASQLGGTTLYLGGNSELRLRNSIINITPGLANSCNALDGTVDIVSDTASIMQYPFNCFSQARNIDARLGELVGSGANQLYPIGPNSPAFDSGTSEHCLVRDQRGLRRELTACDVGAFEYDKSTFIVIPLPDNKAVVVPN